MERGLLSELLSARSQRELSLMGTSVADLAGALRLDLLLWGKLVIPDSHLFDGSLLLELGPAALKDITAHLSDEPRLEVRLRRETFYESLKECVVDDATNSPRPHEWHALLDAEQVRGLADFLPSASVSASDPYEVIQRALGEFGIADEGISRLLEGWRGWQAVRAEDGLYGRWPSQPFELAAAAEKSPFLPNLLNSPTAKATYETVKELIASGDTRAIAADQILRKGEAAVRSDTSEAGEVELVREWYNDCREYAIAKQQGTLVGSKLDSYREMARLTLGRGTTPEATAVRGADAEAFRRLTFVLGELSPSEFRDILRQTNKRRLDWLSTRSHKSLYGLVASIEDIVRPSRNPPAEWAGISSQKIILTSGGMAAGWFLHGQGALVGGGALALGIQQVGTWFRDHLRHRTITGALVRWIEETGPSKP